MIPGVYSWVMGIEGGLLGCFAISGWQCPAQNNLFALGNGEQRQCLTDELMIPRFGRIYYTIFIHLTALDPYDFPSFTRRFSKTEKISGRPGTSRRLFSPGSPQACRRQRRYQGS